MMPGSLKRMFRSSRPQPSCARCKGHGYLVSIEPYEVRAGALPYQWTGTGYKMAEIPCPDCVKANG